MLRLTKLRELNLHAPPQLGRPAHLSAASGLVCVGEFLYIIADDELHLGVFAAHGNEPGDLLRLRAGKLPGSRAARKAVKPDLEALALLPASEAYPHGALLALGSGSKPQRRSGCVIGLDVRGGIGGEPRWLDFSNVFAALAEEIADINIEGAVIAASNLRLLQRGNKSDSRSAVIDIDWPRLWRSLQTGAAIDVQVSRMAWFDLGSIEGVPLSFSDGAALSDGSLIFTAIAEDTRDSYADGRCLGAAIGMIDIHSELQTLRPLAEPLKIEGIALCSTTLGTQLLLVTDADDPDVPAALYSTALPLS